MRKNVLFIAKFDNILKGTNAILAKTFNMQMCPPEPDMVEKTLGVMEMDLVLIYVSGLEENQINGMRLKLNKSIMKAPVVVFGTEEDCDVFKKRCHIDLNIYLYLHRPIGASRIVKELSAILDVEGVYEAPKPPDVSSGMSIADFAAALDSDERRLILVVDDNGVILRAMKMLLEKTYRVNLANSTMNALASIKQECPDAVLLDYEMPVFDGKKALEMIRNTDSFKDLPVFFLTGVKDQNKIRELAPLNPQGYFLKDSDLNSILYSLNDYFRKNSKAAEETDEEDEEEKEEEKEGEEEENKD